MDDCEIVHYPGRQAIFQAFFSFKIAGDPAGFADKVLKSWSRRSGWSKFGTASTAAGAAFGVLGKITGGVKVVSQSIDGKDATSSAASMPENVAQGIALGGAGFGKTFLARIADIGKKPVAGFRRDGVGGLAKGVAGGVVGALASPFLATAKFTETVLGSIEAQSHAFKDKEIKMALRPRRFYVSKDDMLLKPFSDCTTLSSFDICFPRVRVW